MRIAAKGLRLQYASDGRVEVVVTTDSRKLDISKPLQVLANDKPLEVELKQCRPPRSNDANAYLWVLCKQIAEAVGTTKELVYQQHIRDVGQFDFLPVVAEGVDTFIARWGARGLGWFAEVMEPSKLPGYVKVIAYYGSSVYNSREMAVLLDEVINTCRELDIETLPPGDVALLKEAWHDDQTKKGGENS